MNISGTRNIAARTGMPCIRYCRGIYLRHQFFAVILGPNLTNSRSHCETQENLGTSTREKKRDFRTKLSKVKASYVVFLLSFPRTVFRPHRDQAGYKRFRARDGRVWLLGETRVLCHWSACVGQYSALH